MPKNISAYKEDVYRCGSSCLNCTVSFPMFLPLCPSLERHGFMSYSCKGKAGVLEGYLAGKIELSPAIAKIMYSCALCGACRESCFLEWRDYNLEAFIAMREELVEKGMIPPKVRDYLESTYLHGNPYGLSRANRDKWSEHLDLPRYSGEEYLYYVGSVGSYDTRSQKAAKALAEVFKKADISFGILGAEENCDGNEVIGLGERGLFEELAEANIKKFKELGVTKIVTLSPHAYNAFKNYYPAYNGEFQIYHYTQLISMLLSKQKLVLSKVKGLKITYHDPCYLGRHNNEYEAPRMILKSLGFKLLEMERNRENSFCCGGGGGNFYTDLLGGGENSTNRIRIKEALETGAEILVVSCPTCLSMLEDAVKTANQEENLKVLDISEILAEHLM